MKKIIFILHLSYRLRDDNTLSDQLNLQLKKTLSPGFFLEAPSHLNILIYAILDFASNEMTRIIKEAGKWLQYWEGALLLEY